ncbi:unnamed protein product [Zymoseptoria tritici ST99CH_1E4]|nr:unnamed protein product [Zymoseptoria tritici ST99CH_1E4]
MSGIGAELPPHLLAKRKRQQDEDADVAPTTASGAKRASSPDEPDKRQRVIGPAMPPAPLDQRPSHPPNTIEDDSSDEDDDFGPALPTGDAISNDNDDHTQNAVSDAPQAEEKLKRDDWMMMPPKQDDLAARMDPSVQRPRGFNTGKGAKAPNTGGDDSSIWHETPEQKRKRLADEMMGVGTTSMTTRPNPVKISKKTGAHEKIQEHIEKTRGPSLMDQHAKTKGVEAEDDPSKRAFDREKDMGSGGRISTTQKREMLNKAAGFSDKFSGGSYLCGTVLDEPGLLQGRNPICGLDDATHAVVHRKPSPSPAILGTTRMDIAARLQKRQNTGDMSNSVNDDYYDGNWWWSDTGYAIRYTIIIVILAIILLYFVGGYFHARRRMKKGLPLKRYHRWMVRRQYRQQQHAAPQYNAYYQDPNQQGYPMQPYGNNPPPPYVAPPPAYAPPEGASKAMADQNYTHLAQAGGPSGPPPPAAMRQ